MKNTLALLLAVAIAQFTGCGGSGNGSQSATVRILSNQFSPKVLTIKAGDRVTWVNADTKPHKIVSGTLLPTTNPQTRTPIISINQNNTFSPSTFQANLGDTIQWQNNRMSDFIMDILDETGSLVASLQFVRSGQVLQFSGFPNAGLYTFQQRNNPLFAGAVTVFGTPSPNGAFQSQRLNPGDSFTTRLNSPGTFNYFGLNEAEPNRSFLTGKIVVQ
jgi:plastocyanin